MVRINIKLLLVTIASVIIGGLGVFGLHHFQALRTSSELLKRAERAEKEGQPKRAAVFLYRYLSFKPEDVEATARYGAALQSMAATKDQLGQVQEVYEKVVRLDPDRADIRRKLADIALFVGRTPDARYHAEILQKSAPKDGQIELILGRCDQADGQYAKAAAHYEKARTYAPTVIENYTRLAILLRTQLNDPRRADKVMDELIAANGKSFEAYYARGMYRRRFGESAAGVKDLDQALALKPDHPEVLLAVAQAAQDRGDLKRAIECLERGVKASPRDPRMYRALATVHLGAGSSDDAESSLDAGITAISASHPEEVKELKWMLAGIWAQRGRVEKARELLQNLRDSGFPGELVDYIEAQALMSQFQWSAAAQKLEAVRPLLESRPQLMKQTDVELSKCYERLGSNEQRTTVLRRLSRIDPTMEDARRMLAASLAAKGQIDEAIVEYRRLASKNPDDKVALARLIVLRTLRQPVVQRNWEEADQTLKEARESTKDSPGAVILQAEVFLARDRFDDAETLLKEKRDKNPDQVEYWLGLIALAERRDKMDEIPKLLDDAQKWLGDRVELRLARARYLTVRGGPDLKKSLEKLTQDTGKLGEGDKARLIRGMTEEFSRANDPSGALATWKQMAKLRPNILSVHLITFDLAVEAGDEREMTATLNAIRGIEGDEGELSKYCRARQLIWKAKRGEKASLPEARQLLSNIAVKLPAWSRIPMSEAEIKELSGDPDGAAKSYLQAVDLGERDPLNVRHILQLLFAQRRYDDANRVLSKIQDQTLASGNLQRLAAELSVRNQDYSRALELARKAVSSESSDYHDHLWLGQILFAVGRKGEAEAPLRRAVELAGNDPAPWVSLVQYLVAMGQKKAADDAVREAEAKLTRKKEPLALAQCYGLIGQKDQAEALFKEAIAAKPNDPTTLRVVATNMLQTDRRAEAEPLLQKIIDQKSRSADDARWARRVLAMILAASGDPERSLRALEILDVAESRTAGASASAEAVEDMRAQAKVLAVQPKPSQRQEAIRLLEEIGRREEPTVDDQVLLAQLYESQGEWPQANDVMQKVLTVNNKSPQILTQYIQSLIRNKQADRASTWLAQLEQLTPRALSTKELKARMLSAQGKNDEAIAVLENMVRDDPSQLLPVATILETIGQVAVAEKMFRKYVSETSKQSPQNMLVLARFLGRQNRTKEALDICEEAWKAAPPGNVANVCVDILGNTHPVDDATTRRVETWLVDALRKQPNTSELMTPVAYLRSIQGRFAEAESIYRQVLKTNPKSILALNNLAWLLAHEPGKGAEAVEKINLAIDLMGARPPLLDTRAVAQLSVNHVSQAVRDLEWAVALAPEAPMYFHLAKAHWMAKSEKPAREAIRKGEELGLKPTNLDPLDQADYARFMAELNRR